MPWTKEQRREYNQTPNGKKTQAIGNWKYIGLVTSSKEEMEEIYARYLASERCEKKGCEYTKNNKKHMDHDHKTGAFRNILCHACNSNDRVDNTSGTPNVSKYKYGWRYKIQKNKKTHIKYFKTKEEAIDYKIKYESGNI